MAGIAIGSPSETQYSTGRVSGTITIEDPRFNCEAVTVTVVPDANSSQAHPKGVLTVDFGSSGLLLILRVMSAKEN